MVKAVLLKPLDSDPQGAVREFDQTDFDALVALGAVRPTTDDDDLRQDGPTVADFVAAGYKASNYPPHGYASRSTAEEIAAAVAAEKSPEPKKAPSVKNKMMTEPVANKSAFRAQEEHNSVPEPASEGTATPQTQT